MRHTRSQGQDAASQTDDSDVPHTLSQVRDAASQTNDDSEVPCTLSQVQDDASQTHDDSDMLTLKHEIDRLHEENTYLAKQLSRIGLKYEKLLSKMSATDQKNNDVKTETDATQETPQRQQRSRCNSVSSTYDVDLQETTRLCDIHILDFIAPDYVLENGDSATETTEVTTAESSHLSAPVRKRKRKSFKSP